MEQYHSNESIAALRALIKEGLEHEEGYEAKIETQNRALLDNAKYKDCWGLSIDALSTSHATSSEENSGGQLDVEMHNENE